MRCPSKTRTEISILMLLWTLWNALKFGEHGVWWLEESIPQGERGMGTPKNLRSPFPPYFEYFMAINRNQRGRHHPDALGTSSSILRAGWVAAEGSQEVRVSSKPPEWWVTKTAKKGQRKRTRKKRGGGLDAREGADDWSPLSNPLGSH